MAYDKDSISARTVKIEGSAKVVGKGWKKKEILNVKI
jgi:hypothetical protein